MFSLRKMLVATDFSDASDVAVDKALELAATMGAQVTLVHTYGLPTYGFPDGAMIAQGDVAADLSTSLTQALQNEVTARADRGVPMGYVLRMGSAADGINDVAEEIGADMIVVGTHGRRGLAHVLLGSTAEQVLRSATRPVLVVRTPEETRADEVTEEKPERVDAPHVARAH